jgi:hypothetical protein
MATNLYIIPSIWYIQNPSINSKYTLVSEIAGYKFPIGTYTLVISNQSRPDKVYTQEITNEESRLVFENQDNKFVDGDQGNWNVSLISTNDQSEYEFNNNINVQ